MGINATALAAHAGITQALCRETGSPIVPLRHARDHPAATSACPFFKGREQPGWRRVVYGRFRRIHIIPGHFGNGRLTDLTVAVRWNHGWRYPTGSGSAPLRAAGGQAVLKRW